MIFLILIPINLFSLYHFFEIVGQLKTDVRERESAVSIGIIGDVDNAVKNSFAVIHALSQHPAVMERNSGECDRLFAALLPRYPLLLNITASDMDGRNYGSSGNYKPEEVRSLMYTDKEWFKTARMGNNVVGDLHISNLFKRPTVMLPGPVLNSAGKQVGIIGTALDLSRLTERLSRWPLSDNSLTIVVDSNGNIACQ